MAPPCHRGRCIWDDARDAGARADHALGVAAQVVERHARLIVKALHGGLGDRLHQVDVSLLVLGQKDHVVELGLMVAGKRLVRRKVDLAAKDGLDDQRRLELVDVALLVPHGHVLHILGMLARAGLGIGLHQLVAAVLFQEGLVVAPGFVLGRVVVDGVAGQRQIGYAVHVAWSVMATAGMPSSTARLTISWIRVAPSSIEKTVWLCRWTNAM